MRLNKFIASTGRYSRRSADRLIEQNRVKVNGRTAKVGQNITENDQVEVDSRPVFIQRTKTLLILNKPEGYVCSRRGQGSKTIYQLLPDKFGVLKPVGRLDKDSEGLILLTDDGNLANKLAHPRYQKHKIYEVNLDKKLSPRDSSRLLTGVELTDGVSKFIKVRFVHSKNYEITLSEGRNRQIRRTFSELGYKVTKLRRTKFGPYSLESLKLGRHIIIESKS